MLGAGKHSTKGRKKASAYYFFPMEKYVNTFFFKVSIAHKKIEC